MNSPCLLIYDIPESSSVRNPSGELRRRAVRINLSCWVICEQDIPYYLLNEMQIGGATWHVVRFDPREGENLLRMAIESLKRDLKTAVKRAKTARWRAGEQLETNADLTKYERQARVIVRRVKKMLDSAREAANRFGIGEDTINLAHSVNAIDAIKTSMKERARQYAETAATLRQVGDEAMAQAVQSDQIPAGVVADRIDDAGEDATALRTVFDGVI